MKLRRKRLVPSGLPLRWSTVKNFQNLRRVSCSPWADMEKMAENLDDKYIYSMKHLSPDIVALEFHKDREALIEQRKSVTPEEEERADPEHRTTVWAFRIGDSWFRGKHQPVVTFLDERFGRTSTFIQGCISRVTRVHKRGGWRDNQLVAGIQYSTESSEVEIGFFPRKEATQLFFCSRCGQNPDFFTKSSYYSSQGTITFRETNVPLCSSCT